MVSSSNYQLHVRYLRREQAEGLDHEFQTLVRSPLSEGQYAMSRIPPARKIRKFRTARKNAVRAQVHIVSPVFVVQDFPISGHQHRD
jgi:hypothetical protein